MPGLALPRNLVTAARREGRAGWLDTLPAKVVELEQRWSISVGPPFQPGGLTAWVAPAQDGDGRDLVVKLAWRHPETDHEPDALRLWSGHGAVHLYTVEESDDTVALLLERCRTGSTLATRPEPEQDQVIAELLPRLWQRPPAGHRFRPLRVMCEQWAQEFEAKTQSGRSVLDAGLARAGIALFRSLPDSADEARVLCTDLHAGNVLAAQREPWLVIDPNPYVGDPTYDVLQHMLNCPGRLRADPGGLARRMAELTGLDPQRLELWLFARCVQESPNWPRLASVARRIAPR